MKTGEATNRRVWIRWGIVFFGWTIIGAFFVSRNIVSTLSRGQAIAWHRHILFELLYWYIWALLTPLIFRLADRYRILGRGWQRNALALTFWGLLIAVVQMAIDYAVNLSLAIWVIRVPEQEISRVLAGIKTSIIVESFAGFLTYWVILGIYYAFDYYRKYHDREVKALQLEGRLAQAELQNLKMQLHPHFLFNTLNTISVLILEDAQAANYMLVRLSDLLRITLESAGAQEVSLKQEIEFLQSYLEIEQTRFQDRLTVRFDVDPSTLNARVPNLILQPLVENAIRHGIAPRASPGLIEIQASRTNGVINLLVRDNGPGLRGSDPETIAKGVGLTNTQARLHHLYGKSHRFDLQESPEGGLMVKVQIPFCAEIQWRDDGKAQSPDSR